MNKLQSVIATWSDRPFRYGHDCCQFAGAVVEAVKGWNPMDTFIYDGERSAVELIASYGGLQQAVSSVLGDPVDPKDFTDGDVALVKLSSGESMVGVFLMNKLVVKDKSGIRGLSPCMASMVWSVPNG